MPGARKLLVGNVAASGGAPSRCGKRRGIGKAGPRVGRRGCLAQRGRNSGAGGDLPPLSARWVGGRRRAHADSPPSPQAAPPKVCEVSWMSDSSVIVLPVADPRAPRPGVRSRKNGGFQRKGPGKENTRDRNRGIMGTGRGPSRCGR